MKTASAELTAAVKAAQRFPRFQIIVDDRSTGIPRLRWVSWYTGGEAACHTAVCACGSYVIQCRSVGGEVYYRRTLIGGTPGSWTKFAGTVYSSAAISLASVGNTAFLFFVDSADNRTIKYRLSTDAGDTWSAAATVVTAGSSGKVVTSLAGVCPGDGPYGCILIYCVGSNNDTTQDKEIRAIVYSSGSWSGDAGWGRTSGKRVRGIGACAMACTASLARVAFCVGGQFEVFNRGSQLPFFSLEINNVGVKTWTYRGNPMNQYSFNYGSYWPSMVPEGDIDRCRVFFDYYDARANRPAHGQHIRA